MNNRKVTLALGGGGARGVTHLGVIESLLRGGIEVERVVGISIGSLAGAVYAFNPDITDVQLRVRQYLSSSRFRKHQEILFNSRPSRNQSDDPGGSFFSWYENVKSFLRANSIFRRVISRPSMLPGLVLQEVVNNLLPDADIADAKIPLAIEAVDLRSGHRVVLEKGSVRQAVKASSSIPGIFPPVDFGEMQLCDVGVLCSVPTVVARTYNPRCLVAVDVSSNLRTVHRCETAIDVLIRTDEIGEVMFRKQVQNLADVLIHPRVDGIEWFDFSVAHELIEAGRQAGQHSLPQLHAFLDRE